jgi:hypothetical protein
MKFKVIISGVANRGRSMCFMWPANISFCNIRKNNCLTSENTSLMSVFVSNYRSEQLFSLMKNVKSRARTSLTDESQILVHLQK